MKPTKFSIHTRMQSFKYAFQGLITFFQKEHNGKIHLFCALLTVIVGIITQLSPLEWIVISFSISSVITTELINTSIEGIADFISPERNQAIKQIKDIAAAAVLITAISSAIAGGIIFIPKILEAILLP
ncbi:diacylglycerol kinase family protein [bacterium]|nr:diacylglycerol kinase family protein [bacterium]